MLNKHFVNSPLNYTGGKFKLLPQLQPLFPKKEFATFYDVFTGGGVVAANANTLLSCQSVEATDVIPELIELLCWFKDNAPDDIINTLDKISDKYGLTNTSKNGYDFYKVDSSNGVGSVNRNAYTKLRDDYNQARHNQTASTEMLYLLIVYAFNNQIRFNAAGDFNLPVGKRDLNNSMRKKIREFSSAISKNTSFICRDFRQTIERATEDDFLYCDPPYLITLAGYNENGGWSNQDDLDLMELLTAAHERGALFAMSNVIEHKGQSNDALAQWAAEHQFNVHKLNYNYNNSNYQSQARSSKTVEVLITNYAIVE